MSKNATKLKKKQAREKQVEKENNEQRNTRNKNKFKADRKNITKFNRMNRGERKQVLKKANTGGILSKIKTLFEGK